MVSQMGTDHQTYQVVYIKYVWLFICQSYLKMVMYLIDTNAYIFSHTWAPMCGTNGKEPAC